MIELHMIDTNLARQMARRAGMFARVSASGGRLIFYTGNEKDAGSWLEAGSTLIDARGGMCVVSRNTVEIILR